MGESSIESVKSIRRQVGQGAAIQAIFQLACDNVTLAVNTQSSLRYAMEAITVLATADLDIPPPTAPWSEKDKKTHNEEEEKGEPDET
jgi:hypothetical protein